MIDICTPEQLILVMAQLEKTLGASIAAEMPLLDVLSSDASLDNLN